MKTMHDRVYEVLSSIFPKPISQIVEESGLAYSTVHDHLERMHALRVESPPKPVRYLRPSTDTNRIPVFVTPNSDVIRSGRVTRESTAEDIRTLTIVEGADPIWLADQFIEHGKRLIEIGVALEKVKLDPDWHQKLGGRVFL